MDKFLYLISEGLKNVWRHKMTTFTAVFSLFLALYFVGLLATAGENTKSILQYLRSKYKIEVFFKQNIDLKAATGSRFPVGSSAKISEGSLTMALAKVTLCFSPPDNS